jgi:fructokinase
VATRARLTVVGENIIDLVPLGDSTRDYRALPGGSPANIAVAASRLGTPTALLARVSTDVFGQRVRERLAADGVLDTHLVEATEPSSLAVVTFDTERRASYGFWLTGTVDWQWSDQELARRLGEEVRAVHVGSIAAYREPGAAAILRMLRRERERGAVSITVDPNVRPEVIGGLDHARERTEELVRLADVVKASDEDLALLYPDLDHAGAARQWLALGPSLVVVTRGPNGALGLGRTAVVEASAPAIDLVDTVGAGDTFMGALLHALDRRDLLGGPARDRLAHVEKETLHEVLTTAAVAAALNCAREGADPPTAAELDHALRRATPS